MHLTGFEPAISYITIRTNMCMPIPPQVHILAGELRLELRIIGSKPIALPLGYSPIYYNSNYNNLNYKCFSLSSPFTATFNKSFAIILASSFDIW